jgi:hypothetical protein
MVKERTGMLRMIAAITGLALILGLAGPRAVDAEIITVPPAAPPDPAVSLPPPTVLRGSPPTTSGPVPVCPPGYTLSLEHNCVAPSGGEYSEATPNYDYWPDYGFGYPLGGFGFGGAGDHRSGFHGGHRFHRRPAFHNAAKSGAPRAPAGHVGGFGRR